MVPVVWGPRLCLVPKESGGVVMWFLMVGNRGKSLAIVHKSSENFEKCTMFTKDLSFIVKTFSMVRIIVSQY